MTESVIVYDFYDAQLIIEHLMDRHCEFKYTPLPLDSYQITTKPEHHLKWITDRFMLKHKFIKE